ncbi:MAG: hypothetical protein QXX34_03535 [Candidatus Bathyarchaeia archaeon]
MTRKYICDNCGKEFQYETAVCNIEFRTYNNGELYDCLVASNSEGEPADYCKECQEKIRKYLAEGFQ